MTVVLEVGTRGGDGLVARGGGPDTAVAEDSVYGTYGGNAVWFADSLGEELFSNFPREHSGVFLLETEDFLHYCWGCHLLKKKKTQ